MNAYQVQFATAKSTRNNFATFHARATHLGCEIEPPLADAIVKQFKAARNKPAATEKKPE